MIRYKQKEFWIGPALTVGSTLLGLKQSSDQSEQMKEQAEAQAEQMEKHDELLKEQNRKLDRIAERAKSNPEQAMAAASSLDQKQKEFGFSVGTLRNIAKAKGAITSFGKEAAGLASNVGKAGGVTFGKSMAGNVATGVAMGVAGYAGGKFIQHNMKKNNLDTDENGNLVQTGQQQRAYSALSGISTMGKSFGKMVGNNLKKKSTWVMAGGFTAVPAVMGYMSDKKQMNDQIAATQQEQQQAPQQKAYAAVNPGFIGKVTSAVKNFKPSSLKPGWWDFNKFKAHPAQTMSGFAANVGSFGMMGTKQVQKFGKRLEELGKGGTLGKGITGTQNNAAVKVGQFIQNHKTAANLGAIGAGVGLTKLTWDGSQALTKKIGKTLDPGAYKYQDAQDKKAQLAQQQQAGQIEQQ